MKKVISLLLSIIMIFSTLFCADFSAFATEHTHTFTNGVCTSCQKAVETGYDFHPVNIFLETPTAMPVYTRYESAAYRFTAPADSYYEFSVKAERSLMIYTLLIDEAYNVLASKLSPLGSIILPLQKGKSYTFLAYYADVDILGTITATVKLHQHTLETVDVKPTCQKDGKKGEVCNVCGYSKLEKLPAGEAYHEFVNGACLTCRKKDPTYVWTLTDLKCGEETSNEITLFSEMHGYSFIPEEDGCYAIIADAPTVGLQLEYSTTDGSSGFSSIYDCDGVKKSIAYVALTAGVQCKITVYYNRYYHNRSTEKLGPYTLYIEKHEHQYEVYRNTVTCSSDGTKHSKCSICGRYLDETIPADGTSHSFKNGFCKYCGLAEEGYTPQRIVLNLDEEATLTSTKGQDVFFSFTPAEDGYYYFTGMNNKASYYEIYDADNTLVYEKNQTTKAVYRALKGGITYSIKAWAAFDNIDTDITLKAVKHEHQLSSWTTKEPSCTEDGERRVRCNDYCGYDVTEVIPTDGSHTFINGKCKYCEAVDENYVKVVTPLGDTDSPRYTFTDATEEAYYSFTPSATGNYCLSLVKTTPQGYYISISPYVYVYDEDDKLISPYHTYAYAGVSTEKRYYKLEEGKNYSVKVRGGRKDTSVTLQLSQHTHTYTDNNYQPRCDAYVTVTYSCACGDRYQVEYDPTGEHQFTETVIAPTCTEGGKTEMKCKTCGICYDYDYTPSDPTAHHFKNGICEDCGTYENASEKTVLRLNSVTNFTLDNDSKELEAAFTPDETGYYYFRSFSSYDLYAELYDMNETEVNEDDDSGYSMDFCLPAYLEAGKEYRLFIGTYEDFKDLGVKEITFDMVCGVHSHTYSHDFTVDPTAESKGFTLYSCSCGDYFVSGVKEAGTGKVCEHDYKKEHTYAPTCTEEGFTLYYCTKCYDTYTADITAPTGKHEYFNNYCDNCGARKPRTVDLGSYSLMLDEPMEVRINTTDEKVYLTFTPEESGTYLFNTTGKFDIYALLYDENGKQLAEDKDNSGIAKNAQIAYDMVGGCTYSFELQLNAGKDADFLAAITKHTHDFAHYIVPATCGEDGIGIHTCKTCFYSYQDVPEQATGNHHMVDGICSECGYLDTIDHPTEITSFSKITVPAHKEAMMYAFTAPHNGKLTIEALSNGITTAALFTEDLNHLLLDAEANGTGMNFKINADITAGTKYYLVVNSLPRAYDINFNFETVHDYELAEKLAPTCQSQGKSMYRCRTCNEIMYSDYTEPIDHHFVLSEESKATCTEKGKKVFNCTMCGKERIEETPATGHKAVADKAVAATYDRAGKTAGSHCQVCKAVIVKQKVIPKLMPPQTALTKVTGKKKSIVVKWKKQTKNVNGYQIQYSLSPTFASGNKAVTVTKNKTVTKTIKKLKAKKVYYVRIRTYKVINGKKYYSAWSKTLKVKTK